MLESITAVLGGKRCCTLDMLAVFYKVTGRQTNRNREFTLTGNLVCMSLDDERKPAEGRFPQIVAMKFPLLTGGGGAKCESRVCPRPVCYWKKATARREVMGSVGGQLGSLRARLRFRWTFLVTDTCWPTRVTRSVVSVRRSTGAVHVASAFVSFIVLVTRSVSLSLSSLLGKILFRRSHVRDVAMKRLRFIDDYCRVRLNSLSACLPSGSSRKSPPLSHGLHGQSHTVTFHRKHQTHEGGGGGGGAALKTAGACGRRGACLSRSETSDAL